MAVIWRDTRWQFHCNGAFLSAGLHAGGRGQERMVRIAMAAWLTLALVLVGLGVGRASDRDEAVVTAKVTSADHEVQEGYFSLGDNVTVIAKPGTDLYRFLSRQRGHNVKVQLTEAAGPELSRLER
jgi:hypothetical protein